MILSGFTYAQSRTAVPKKGEGLNTFLARHHISKKKDRKKFVELNKGRFSKKGGLLAGVRYRLPNKLYRKTDEPLFGKKYRKFKKVSNKLSGAAFYLVSGHGGPDPGAIGRYQGKVLHEDEYAYDVTLRLARKLMENGAKVHIIIQDKKDGIRDAAILPTSKRETCMGRRIPLSQVARLKQRANAVNKLYRKDRKVKYKRCIVLHVDSRKRNKEIDVFFYHHKNSNKGKRLAKKISDNFTAKYHEYQPGRGFSGSISTRGLYVIRKIKPPIVYIELGNIQNQMNQIRLMKPNNRQALANWIYEGIYKDYKRK